MIIFNYYNFFFFYVSKVSVFKNTVFKFFVDAFPSVKMTLKSSKDVSFNGFSLVSIVIYLIFTFLFYFMSFIPSRGRVAGPDARIQLLAAK